MPEYDDDSKFVNLQMRNRTRTLVDIEMDADSDLENFEQTN